MNRKRGVMNARTCLLLLTCIQSPDWDLFYRTVSWTTSFGLLGEVQPLIDYFVHLHFPFLQLGLWQDDDPFQKFRKIHNPAVPVAGWCRPSLHTNKMKYHPHPPTSDDADIFYAVWCFFSYLLNWSVILFNFYLILSVSNKIQLVVMLLSL